MSRASIASSDCSTDPGLCGKHGSCVAKDCVCESGWFGLFCSFREPCPTLELDMRRGDSLGSAERSWSTRYEILQFGNTYAKIHDFPVYVTETNPPGRVAHGEEEEFDILFFSGVRWVRMNEQNEQKSLGVPFLLFLTFELCHFPSIPGNLIFH